VTRKFLPLILPVLLCGCSYSFDRDALRADPTDVPPQMAPRTGRIIIEGSEPTSDRVLISQLDLRTGSSLQPSEDNTPVASAPRDLDLEISEVQAMCFLAAIDQPVAAIFYSFSANRDSPPFIWNDQLRVDGPMTGITVSKCVPTSTKIDEKQPLRRMFGLTVITSAQ
jgi:hypothetical protein